MKILRFLLFIFLIYSFLPGYTFSYSAEEDISAGIELFKSGRFEQSYQALLKAVEYSPENLELNFYLGRAAFEIHNYEMAIMAFERILIASPKEQRVKLEMARAFQRLGANDIARQYCNEVLMSNPPEAVKENIRKFLIYIDTTEQRHFIRGTLSAGIDWNNNVWASSSNGKIKSLIGDITLTGPSSKKTQDWIYNTVLGLDHTYRFSYSKNSWKTQSIFYKALYDETSALDLRYIGAMTGPEIILNNNLLGFKFLINQVELGNTEYLKSTGFKTSLDHIFHPGLVLNTAIKYESKDFPGLSEKDADNMAALMDLLIYNKKTWYNIGLKAEKENAYNDEYTYTRYVSSLSLSRELPFKITGSLSYAYQSTDYQERNALFSEPREDRQHMAGCRLKRKLWQSKNQNQYMTLDLNFQHTWAFSNIELYDYRMGLMQLFLTYNF